MANDCSRQSAVDRARNRSRNNAANALDQTCLNTITIAIAGAACTRVNRVVNTSLISPIFPIDGLPPLGRTWHAVKVIGHGFAAGNANPASFSKTCRWTSAPKMRTARVCSGRRAFLPKPERVRAAELSARANS
jgi:hypothetical protein